MQMNGPFRIRPNDPHACTHAPFHRIRFANFHVPMKRSIDRSSLSSLFSGNKRDDCFGVSFSRCLTSTTTLMMMMSVTRHLITRNCAVWVSFVGVKYPRPVIRYASRISSTRIDLSIPLCPGRRRRRCSIGSEGEEEGQETKARCSRARTRSRNTGEK